MIFNLFLLLINTIKIFVLTMAVLNMLKYRHRREF
jgi:hypothetical protein